MDIILKEPYQELYKAHGWFENNFQKNEDNYFGIIAYDMALKSFYDIDSGLNCIQQEDKEYLLYMIADPRYGLPFGQIPKSLLFIILKEVMSTKSPVLRLGKIYSRLVRIYQYNMVEDRHKLYDQLLRLFSTEISFFCQNTTGNVTFNFWWNPLKIKKENFSASSTIVLSKELFDQLAKF